MPVNIDFTLGWVTELVHRHRARLAAIARREGLSGEEALDCVQDAFGTFLQLPEAPALRGDPEGAAKVLNAIVGNHARNMRRRHHKARPHVSDELTLDALKGPGGTAEELVSLAEEHTVLWGCIDALGEIQRDVVTLRMLDERPGEDVAEELGITPGHVAVLLHRAKRKLRTCIEEQGQIMAAEREAATGQARG